MSAIFPAERALAAADPVLVRQAAAASDLKPLAEVRVPKAELGGFLNPGAAAKKAAIALGKALFWDMQGGSDGQACGSCHFHAGADSRARNQLSPGLKVVPEDTLFGNNSLSVPGFPQFAPDYTLTALDFPLHRVLDPAASAFPKAVTQDTNDVVSSMGAFAANFTAIGAPLLDHGAPFADPAFNLGNPLATVIADNVRRVEPRNTPTVINAVFNHSNFWDGRAHNLFNGASVIGPLDPAAKIWVLDDSGRPRKRRVRIPNSSLASQAVGPPTSDLEMSFFSRPFTQIGRKLLKLPPLGQQLVHPADSVLGPLSRQRRTPGTPGLSTSYPRLIRTAFQPRYWNSKQRVPGGFTQMEANFTLFWGLAIQMYESTLVSDRAPFDSFMAGDNAALTAEQLQGLLVFLNRGPGRNDPAVDAAISAFQTATPGVAVGVGNCISCHGGPEFTDAAFSSLTDPEEGGLELIEIEDTAVVGGAGLLQINPNPAAQALLDNGFSNIGTRPTADDPGRGGLGGAFPLSFTLQALSGFETILPPDAELPLVPPGTQVLQVQVDGAFKIPGLRNVELTGPYFHNGGQATLSQVVEFYDRQSDFGDANIVSLDRNMAFINLEAPDEAPLVRFLVALTDPRVRDEAAPFDHPQLRVPNGGTFGAEQPPLLVEAVGAGGRPAAGLPPLGTFLGLTP